MGKIDLVGGNDAGAREQLGIEGSEFFLDHHQRFSRISCSVRDINDMHQQAGPFDMSQKTDSETCAQGCPLYQARDISRHEVPSESISTVPRCGVSVVKGYAATFEWAEEIRQRRADFPALGRPIRPTSASSFKVR